MRHPRDDEMAPAALERAQDQSIETMGRLAEFWGFTRTMGRVYGALFLSKDSLTQADLVERLGVSAANVSMSVNGLMRWGAVHKIHEKGSRKLHYNAEGEIRKIIRNVLGGRERLELREATDTFNDAAALLRETEVQSSEDLFAKQRIEHLESVVRISNNLLELLLGEGKVDVRAELAEADARAEQRDDDVEDED